MVSKYLFLLKGTRTPWRNGLILGLGQEMYSMSIEHLFILRKKREKREWNLQIYSGSQIMVPGLLEPASSGHLERQIFRPHPRPTESESLGVGPSTLCFTKPSKWISYMFKFENMPMSSPLLLLINEFFFFFFFAGVLPQGNFFTRDKWVVNFYALPVWKSL